MEINYKNENFFINYVDEGDGEVVVILHGWGTHIEVYRSIIEILKPYKRVIVLDMPGFGNSSEPKFAFDVYDYANLVLLFLGKLNIKTCSLIGHSHGGRVSIALSTMENSLDIKKIILLDSAGIVAKKSFRIKFKILTYKFCKKILNYAPIKAMFPNALENFKKGKGSADYNAASEIMRQSLVKCVNSDMRSQMVKIKVETLLIWGENDTATPVADGEIMEKLIPNSGLVKIKNAGHYSYLDNPILFKKVVYSFFKIIE